MIYQRIYIKYAECHDRLGVYDVAVEYYEKAIRHQMKTEALTVDPELVLKTMKATAKLQDPARGLAILNTSLPEIFRPPIRPYWVHWARRRPSANATTQTASAHGGDGDDDDGDETAAESDEYGDLSDDPNADGADADGDPRRLDVTPDPSLSVDAMENGVRLKLLIEWGHLKKMLGEAEILCKVGIPIILTSLNQTSIRLSGRVRSMVNSSEFVSSESPSLGFQVLKSEYLVDITDPEQRESFMGIVLRVAQQVVIVRALGEQLYYDLVIDVARTLTELGKYVAAIELLTDVNTSDKIAQPDLRFELRFLALVIALEFKENRMAYECARLNSMEDPTNLGHWNLFARVISITGVFSWHQKFLVRCLCTLLIVWLVWWVVC